MITFLKSIKNINYLPVINIPRRGGNRARENTQPKIIAMTVKTINQKMVPFGGVAILPNIETHVPHKLKMSTM